MQLTGNDVLKLNHADVMRLRIVEATEQLARTTPIEKISVRRICEQLGISRQTFYEYYEDKYAVSQWYWLRLGEMYLRETGRTLSFYEGNLRMFRAAVQDRVFFKATFAKGSYLSWLDTSRARRIEWLQETVTDYAHAALTPRLVFQIRWLACAESMTVEEWFSSGMRMTPEEISGLIETCVPRELYDLLEAVVRAR